jgi:hypothetical protein
MFLHSSDLLRAASQSSLGKQRADRVGRVLFTLVTTVAAASVSMAGIFGLFAALVERETLFALIGGAAGLAVDANRRRKRAPVIHLMTSMKAAYRDALASAGLVKGGVQ